MSRAVHNFNTLNTVPVGIFSRRVHEHPLAFLNELEKQFIQNNDVNVPQGITLHPTDDAYIIIAEAVGIPSENIDVEILGKNIRIHGSNHLTADADDPNITISAQDSTDEAQADGTLTHWTPAPRSIDYAFQLPGNVIVDEVTAELALGLLTITAPKQPAPQGKKISIHNISLP